VLVSKEKGTALGSETRAQDFDRAATQALIARLDLTPANRGVAETWLSLWRGNELPDRRYLNPADLKRNLSHLALFDVVPGVSVTVRLAGTSFGTMLGMELTGQDWIALAPENHRADRLRVFTDIAAGALCIVARCVEIGLTELTLSEEILLPLAVDSANGVYPVLCHADWKPAPLGVKIKSRAQAVGPPVSFDIIPLPGLVAA
jgi:hypothetical protein